MKILLLNKKDLVMNIEDLIFDEHKVQQCGLFREDLPQLIVRILKHLGYFGTILAMGKWKKSSYDMVILFDSTATKNVLRYIALNKIADKKILYYRNAVVEFNQKLIQPAIKYGYIISTYNCADAKRFQFKYNQQCWNKRLADDMGERKIKQDLFFVGWAKQRYDTIINLKKEAENQGLLTKFIIISKKNEEYTQNRMVDYAECLQDIMCSKAVVDIVGKDNAGLTLRPLEALFCKKKLVTNYTEIIYYDFYSSNKKNIFVLGRDDISQLSGFVNSPFEKCDFNIDDYDIFAWINRFIDLYKYSKN